MPISSPLPPEVLFIVAFSGSVGAIGPFGVVTISNVATFPASSPLSPTPIAFGAMMASDGVGSTINLNLKDSSGVAISTVGTALTTSGGYSLSYGPASPSDPSRWIGGGSIDLFVFNNVATPQPGFNYVAMVALFDKDVGPPAPGFPGYSITAYAGSSIAFTPVGSVPSGILTPNFIGTGGSTSKGADDFYSFSVASMGNAPVGPSSSEPTWVNSFNDSLPTFYDLGTHRVGSLQVALGWYNAAAPSQWTGGNVLGGVLHHIENIPNVNTFIGMDRVAAPLPLPASAGRSWVQIIG